MPDDTARVPVPRDREDDFTDAAAAARRAFAHEQTGATLDHVGRGSIDPAGLPGNVESYLGVAQVPIGLAGPLRIDGEHAAGDVYVPMATTEGTLVASYSRGMRLVHESGGVRTTVLRDRMQRAPSFVMASAREARDLADWIDAHEDDLRSAAEATTSTGRLQEIERWVAGRILFTRFTYTTGDAAGQNMTGKATQAAARWLVEQNPQIERWFLESNVATDKKHSALNVLHTRGKRVTAEATIPRDVLRRVMRVEPEDLYRARQVSTLGGMMAGVTNNGSHSANGITALFIACGQDVANVAESAAAHAYSELRPDGSYYYSITIPSLIVATHGGGTGLPTQAECLGLLGCRGRGTVNRLAEIVAATVLCGELSLGAAIVAEEWVDAHDAHGRNR